MDKKKITIVWSVYEDEGYWYYIFGNKQSPLVKSPRLMTKALAQKGLAREIELEKMKYGKDSEVVTEEIKM